MSLQPELRVRIVVDPDRQQARTDARTSLVYHVDGNTLVLAQTEPSINRSMINTQIVVTYLRNESDVPVRYGISAVITDVIDRFQLTDGQYARGIVVRSTSDPKPYELRMCYRVGPAKKVGLNLSIAGQRIDCIDISLGGMRFSYMSRVGFKADDVIEMILHRGRSALCIQARIIRTWVMDKERIGTGLHFAAAEFLNVKGKIKQALSGAIRDMENASH